ncbi:MAG: BACON domain-containing protein [Bacteroidales bacterium]|nr:BACON domain-containing protein [Bacteroidales bacterium]MDD3521333.1 BACON domain-containing protein [Bacteroidales bacterium]MDD4030603.1 BACON domain-containing protein [Bacteroidales bacterium]MDD4434708.1 BACON domain-containing protein [Bacteroidales bacterium]MDD5732180.1 BACON domain-containing protein [Bacteroidales bacterium]
MKPKRIILAGLALLVLASCQKEPEPFMTLSTKKISVTADGGSVSFDLSANVYYRVLVDENWMSILDKTEAGEITTFNLAVAENTVTSPREGTIRFIGDGVTPLKFTVAQAGVVPRGVSPSDIIVEAEQTSAKFTVLGDKPWTASSSNPAFLLSAQSGVGEMEVTVTFPANEEYSEKSATITVVISGKSYTVTITQKALSLPQGILADWALKEIKDITTEFFMDAALQTTPGTGGKYIPASTGNGIIEYYACARPSEYTFKSGYDCKRLVGGNGDPYVEGTIVGDYWFITGEYVRDIPEGTSIDFYFVTKFGTYVSNYWMIEFLDGDTWKPALPTSKITESATISGATGEPLANPYSAEITYNVMGFFDTSNNGAYHAVQGKFTISVPMKTIKMRFSPSGRVGFKDGKYIDIISQSCQSRFSAQHPSNPDGSAVKEYNEHVTLKFSEQ